MAAPACPKVASSGMLSIVCVTAFKAVSVASSWTSCNWAAELLALSKALAISSWAAFASSTVEFSFRPLAFWMAVPSAFQSLQNWVLAWSTLGPQPTSSSNTTVRITNPIFLFIIYISLLLFRTLSVYGSSRAKSLSDTGQHAVDQAEGVEDKAEGDIRRLDVPEHLAAHASTPQNWVTKSVY